MNTRKRTQTIVLPAHVRIARSELPSAFGTRRDASVMIRMECVTCGGRGSLGTSSPVVVEEWLRLNNWHGDCAS
jgi:hypothetical protein